MQTHSADIPQPALLEEILRAREERQHRQQRLLRRYRRPLISLSLNIAGALKQFPLAQKTYAEASRMMHRHLERMGACVIGAEEVHARSGSEGCFAVDGRDATSLKRGMVALEESRPVASLFD
ncbi:citrate lyase holo-[acyl-carrier protein] synthase, partial [Desulfovibrio piger]|uniref:citrate lyase holo-[acyl-carrier protein] synthase n=1 Tax=Desulfovibrio piger TaxID=901 RepID=UPI0026E9D5E5